MSDMENVGAYLRSSHIVPSLLGAIISLKWAPGLSAFERVFNVGCGVAIGSYGGPAITEWLHLPGERIPYAIAGMMALFGLHAADAIVQWIRALTVTISEWIKTANVSDFIPWPKSRGKHKGEKND